MLARSDVQASVSVLLGATAADVTPDGLLWRDSQSAADEGAASRWGEWQDDFRGGGIGRGAGGRLHAVAVEVVWQTGQVWMPRSSSPSNSSPPDSAVQAR